MKVGKHCSQEHGIVKEVGGVCVFLNGNIAIEMDTFERPELDVHGEPVKEDIEMGKVEVLAEAAEEKESIRRAVQ
ncbi:hypothetical protein RB195_020352 [Necator americanus]|uniref:Uncharacterized protein n=1 Tax=Necator americanus TaxID=51031 RepID=A0ABR1CKA1_NECAM